MVEDYLSIDSRSMAKSNSLADGAAGTWVWKNGKGDIVGSVGYLHQTAYLPSNMQLMAKRYSGTSR